MKKIIIAIVAMFTMGAVANAQNEMEVSYDNNSMTMTVSATDADGMQVSEVIPIERIEDFGFSEMKDYSFPTESQNDMTATLLDMKGGNDRIVGAILAIFLGDFGIHHFYTGDTKHGILHLVFFWTGIPGLIGFIEGLLWLIDESTFPQSLFGGII